ncbi:LysR family transcriptional regulator [Massilia cellulosiltytica]|jgi:DNA-binding transcriptional LysR family regulator|uniref:LysR family transcriptional regulator n=1 Tax=Massilia cellulosiltytica TaxID=2683234 RepID=UPI0039B5C7EE
MELRHLKYFHAVAETLSFSRAAERLHIAQPPLSRQIRQLEELLGAELIDRESRPIALTVAGKFFYEQTYQVLSRLREIEEGTRRLARNQRVWFGIGFVPSVMCGLLPDLIRQFRQAEPGVETGFTELMTMEQAAALKLGRIDVGFGRLPIDDPDIECVTLLREPLLAALPCTHPHADAEVVDLDDLAADPLVVYPARPRPGYADQVLDLFARRGVRPATVREANEMQTALGLVAAGIGVALVPASACQGRRGSVVFRRVAAEEAVSPVIMNFRRGDAGDVLARFRAMAETLLPLAIHTTARAVATPDPAPRIVEWARAAAMPL